MDGSAVYVHEFWNLNISFLDTLFDIAPSLSTHDHKTSR